MNMKAWSDKFLEVSQERKISLEREELALLVAEALWIELERSGLSRADFARKMGKSKGYVTRLLQGNYNLSLGTLAEVAYFLGCKIEIAFQSQKQCTVYGRINHSPFPGKLSVVKGEPWRVDSMDGGEVFLLEAEGKAA